jgi:hypothetical protein
LVFRTGPNAAGSLVALADRIQFWSIDRQRPYEQGRWQIVSQAWDTESDPKSIPAHLIGRKPAA